MHTVLDLFSGVGGFSLGLERAGGFKTIAFCEQDAPARQVLDKHWPDVTKYSDIRNLTYEELRADGVVPSVICGGFPAKMSPKATQSTEMGSKEKGRGYGKRCFDSSEMYTRHGSLRRMFRPYELEGLPWSYKIYLRSGIVLNGTVYPLEPVAHPTDGTEYGSSHTARGPGGKLLRFTWRRNWLLHRSSGETLQRSQRRL